MRKTHLLKTLLCTAMIIMVTGTTVMAGTVTRSQKVRGITTYTNSYTGAVGYYCAAGDGSYARTSLINKSNSKYWFQCCVQCFNVEDQEIEHISIVDGAIVNGGVMSVRVSRNKNTYMRNYIHSTIGCTSSSYSAATAFDKYTFTGKQYYE